MHTFIVYLLPFGLTLALACALRLALGPERGARLAGIATVIGFLVAWGMGVRPGWLAHEPVGRLGHITVGAAIAGLALDFFGLSRICSAIAALVVALVCSWASFNSGLWPPPPFDGKTIAWLAGLAVVAFVFLMRLHALARADITAAVTALMLALGLAGIAAVADDHVILPTALLLVMAVAGFIAASAIVALRIGDGFVLGVGAALLATAWALAQRQMGVDLPMAFLLLMLFADRTARRVPLPKARISAVLYPLILAGICALPLALAVALTLATSRH